NFGQQFLNYSSLFLLKHLHLAYYRHSYQEIAEDNQRFLSLLNGFRHVCLLLSLSSQTNAPLASHISACHYSTTLVLCGMDRRHHQHRLESPHLSPIGQLHYVNQDIPVSKIHSLTLKHGSPLSNWKNDVHYRAELVLPKILFLIEVVLTHRSERSLIV